MKYLISAFLYLFFSSSVSGQIVVNDPVFPSEIFHEGSLVLMDGDSLIGNIKYDLDNDLVIIKQNDDQIRTYSARKILFFEIYDELNESYRTFYSLPYNVQPNYKVPIIFEVLHEGKLTLLGREKIVQETIPNPSIYGTANYYTEMRLMYDYFFLDSKGNIERYLLRKKDLFFIMRKRGHEVKRFMKKNKLRHDRKNDLIKIVEFYNSIT